jgi:hypothetical protein
MAQRTKMRQCHTARCFRASRTIREEVGEAACVELRADVTWIATATRQRCQDLSRRRFVDVFSDGVQRIIVEVQPRREVLPSITKRGGMHRVALTLIVRRLGLWRLLSCL